MQTGDTIKKLRLQNDMTMEDLANLLGVGKSAVNKWEKGYVTNIKRSTIIKMSKIFNVSPVDLMDMDSSDCSEVNHNFIELSDIEQKLILSYRASDEITQKNILKLLDVKE